MQLFGEFVGVDPAQYSAAMRQHFDFVTFMDRLKEDLRLVDPESKRFVEVTDEFDTVFDSDGNKVYQEFSKQAVDDKVILRTLSTMFDDPSGFPLETFKDLTVTRLAQGIPIGGEVHYLDENTLNTAFQSRKKII